MKFLENLWDIIVEFFSFLSPIVNSFRVGILQIANLSKWFDQTDEIISISYSFLPTIVVGSIVSIFTIYVSMRVLRFLTFQAG